jgi:hypothetical protein
MAGQKIDDHSSWVGKGPKGQVFPDGSKMKSYSSAEGSGSVSRYADTSEAIHEDQKHGDSKIKGHPMKSGYRY